MNNQRWWRIVPVAFVMYTIAFVDRTSISLALPSMSRELHMDSAQAGDVAGIFFWGYLLLQIPGGHLAKHWSAKRVISVLLVLWGAAAVSCGLVHTWHELRIMRFVLGVCEGGVQPATLIFLSHWFPRAERARANALWALCIPFAVIASSPLSGWILDHWNWRVMLIAEGILPFVWLLIWVTCVSDHPREDRWISAAERDHLVNTLDCEAREVGPTSSLFYFRALFRRETLILMGIHFFSISGQIGFIIWLPTALGASRGFSHLTVGLLFTLPFIVGAIAMVLNSRHSDRTRERPRHVSAALATGGLSLLAAVALSAGTPTLAFVFACLALIGPYGALGPFWTIPTETLSPDVVGSTVGLINAFGNLGGYFGPVMLGYLNKRTGNFRLGFGLLALGMLIGATLPFLLKTARDMPSQPVKPHGSTAPGRESD